MGENGAVSRPGHRLYPLEINLLPPPQREERIKPVQAVKGVESRVI